MAAGVVGRAGRERSRPAAVHPVSGPARTGGPGGRRCTRPGERHATWLELFFDLVFVLAIAELAHYLHDHLTPGGFLGFAFLFVPVWSAWMGFTYYADLFESTAPPTG